MNGYDKSITTIVLIILYNVEGNEYEEGPNIKQANKFDPEPDLIVTVNQNCKGKVKKVEAMYSIVTGGLFKCNAIICNSDTAYRTLTLKNGSKVELQLDNVNAIQRLVNGNRVYIASVNITEGKCEGGIAFMYEIFTTIQSRLCYTTGIPLIKSNDALFEISGGECETICRGQVKLEFPNGLIN